MLHTTSFGLDEKYQTLLDVSPMSTIAFSNPFSFLQSHRQNYIAKILTWFKQILS